MDPKGQALSAPAPPIPSEAQALTTTPALGASSSIIQTMQTNSKILQSAMKTPTGGIGKLQKRGSVSSKGSLRFLLPGPAVKVRQVEAEEGGYGNRVSCGEVGCSDEDGDSDNDNDEEVSQRSLLGSRRGIERRKRRGWRGGVGGRETGQRRWRDWRGTLVLWVVLIALGSAMGFVFVENAEEISMPEGPGQGSSEGKSFFPLMSVMEWGSERQESMALEKFLLEDSMKLMEGGAGFLEAMELDLDLHKREVPDGAKWLYDAQDRSYDLVPDNTTDRDKMIESRNGAVSSDVEICSETGVGLMKRGGNAVDAVIGESLVLNFRAQLGTSES